MAGLEVEEITGDPGSASADYRGHAEPWRLDVDHRCRSRGRGGARPSIYSTDGTGVGLGGETASLASVDIADATACPRYGLRILRNVKNVPSPEYIQRRITQAGMRPLGIVVDVTNYVMIELGQPHYMRSTAPTCLAAR